MILYRMCVLPAIVLALLLIVSVICGTIKEMKEMLQTELDIYEKCADENNVPYVLLEDIVKNYEIVPLREVKCLLECHLRELNIMSSNGFFNWDRVDEIDNLEIYRPEDKKKAMEAIAICRKEVPQKIGGDLCETAYIGSKCYVDQFKMLNIFMPAPEDLDVLEDE